MGVSPDSGVSAGRGVSSSLGVGSGGVSKGTEYIHNYPLLANLNDSASSDTMTLARASSKTFIPDSGTVTTVTSNNAAFTGSGVLIEPSHTNLITYSQQFDNAAWLKGATVTPNDETDPLGTTTADRMTSAGSYVQQIATHTAGATLKMGMFAKAGNVDYILFSAIDNVTTGNRARACFNISTGALGTSDTIGSGMTVVDRQITDCGNGWYYCEMIFDTTTITSTRFTYYSSSTDATSSTNNGASDYIFIWQADAQEASAYYSPVPTTTASETSLKDDLSMPCDQIPANDFYIEFDWTPLSAPVNGNYIMSLTSGTGGMEIYYSTGFIEWAFPTIGEGGAITGTPSAGTTYTIRIEKTSAGGVVFSMTGFTTDTDATATSDITWPTDGNVGSRYTDALHSHSVIGNVKVGDA